MTPRLPTVDDLARVVDARADAPADRLRVAIEVGRDLSERSDGLIGRFVGEARAAGMSWTEIGALFGTSKQAVQQRYGASGAGEERDGPAAAAGPGQGWPGRWTPAARATLDRATAEAAALGHAYVGTEHVLLALGGEEGQTAGAVLRSLGVTRERMLATRCLGPRHGDPEQPSGRLMPRLKQALERSLRIADALDAPLADTPHLLAGLLAVSDSMAVELLRRLGVDAAEVRAALGEALEVDPRRLGAPRRRRVRLPSRP